MAERTSAGRGNDAANGPMMALETFLDASRPALNAMAEMNAKVYENITAFNKEWVGFVNKRLKEDFSMPQQLAACKSIEDMYGVYTTYMQRAAEQYRDEFEQISKISQSLASETMYRMGEQTTKMQREMRG